jgi:hypothetical protein
LTYSSPNDVDKASAIVAAPLTRPVVYGMVGTVPNDWLTLRIVAMRIVLLAAIPHANTPSMMVVAVICAIVARFLKKD